MSEIDDVVPRLIPSADVASCIEGLTKNYWHQSPVRDALDSVKSNLPVFINELIQPLSSLAPDHPLKYIDRSSKVVEVEIDEFGTPENWYFIGDLHADFYALHSMLQAMHSNSPEFRLVFLGDLVDRGEFHIECIALILIWAIDHPGQITWIAGNHDIAFSRDSETGKFSSSVSPSEFVNTLNEEGSQHELNAKMGEFFIALTQRLPCAVLFPDGLLATHGGFPLADLHGAAANISSKDEYHAWLNSPMCLQDFTWTRITSYRKRMPNRLSKGFSYGFLDFEAFCNLKPELFPAKRMVTGHEHVQEGFHHYVEYLNNPAVTLTGLGFDELEEGDLRYANYRPYLALGRYQQSQIPALIEVPVDIAALRTLHPAGSISGQEKRPNLF